MDTKKGRGAAWRLTKAWTTPCKHWGFFLFLIWSHLLAPPKQWGHLGPTNGTNSFWKLRWCNKIVTPLRKTKHRSPITFIIDQVKDRNSYSQSVFAIVQQVAKFGSSQTLFVAPAAGFFCFQPSWFWKTRCRTFPNKHFRGKIYTMVLFLTSF